MHLFSAGPCFHSEDALVRREISAAVAADSMFAWFLDKHFQVVCDCFFPASIRLGGTSELGEIRAKTRAPPRRKSRAGFCHPTVH